MILPLPLVSGRNEQGRKICRERERERDKKAILGERELSEVEMEHEDSDGLIFPALYLHACIQAPGRQKWEAWPRGRCVLS